jgi:hypothetical protein
MSTRLDEVNLRDAPSNQVVGMARRDTTVRVLPSIEKPAFTKT